MITVFLDRLDRLNPACWYEFPTMAAAKKFAAAARRAHPDRAVTVQKLNTHEGELA